MSLEIEGFIECAVYKNIDCDTCRKIIMHYVGDQFENEIKVSIANYYIEVSKTSSIARGDELHIKIDKLIEILESRNK